MPVPLTGTNIHALWGMHQYVIPGLFFTMIQIILSEKRVLKPLRFGV